MLIFFFTDIENSTRLWEKYPAHMGAALSRHDAILRREIERHGGRIIKYTGDGVFAVFEGGRPLHCAIAVQKALAAEDWGEVREVRIRIALHAGEAERRGEDYFGPTINRTARLLSAGWGGQVLLTPEVLRVTALPEDASTEDLGFHFFKDLGQPQQVYGLLHPELPLRKFPPLRSLSARLHNLPVQPTPFVGREKEVAQVLALLDNPACRLLTLVGPGGIGKTRLALQTAAEKVEDFSHGVYFVPLAALTSPEFLVSAIADALGFSFYSAGEPREQLFNYLREKKILLILDNFEHLVAGAGLVADLLREAPEVKVVATSREALHLRGEWVFPLEGLERPQEEEEEVETYEAVQLFVQGARRARPDFALSAEDRPAVARICRLVEGIPLGIELASSWVRGLSCKEIVREIERGLNFLSSVWRDVPERHRSLRAVFDSSWVLLSEEERRVLVRLSVFRGGFRQEAAEEVAEAGAGFLAALVDRSLLRRGEERYEMLEVVRQYAAEKLRMFGEEEERQERHGLYYLRFLGERKMQLMGKKEVLEEIQRELGNVREAWRWAVERGRWEELGQAAESLGLFYEARSLFYEGEEAFRRAEEGLRGILGRSAGQEAILGRILAHHGWCYERLCCYQEARERFAESLPILHRAGDLEGVAFATGHLGHVLYRLGEYGPARQLLEESLAFSRQSGNLWHVARSLNNLGIVASTLGEHEEARRFYGESLALFRKVGDRRGAAKTLNNLGVVASTLKEFEEARRLYRESLEIFQELGNRRGSAFALMNLGYIAAELDEYADAEQLSLEGLAIFREIGDRWGVANTLSNLGSIACILGKHPASWEYFYEALETAVELQAVPLVLEVLTGIARLLSREGRSGKALEVLAVVLHHPASDRETRERAEHLRTDLQTALPPEAVAASLARGAEREIEQVLEEFLRR